MIPEGNDAFVPCDSYGTTAQFSISGLVNVGVWVINAWLRFLCPRGQCLVSERNNGITGLDFP